MNDKDFDQIFSDKLNEVSAFSGVDDNWQKLNFRLDLVAPIPAPVSPTPPAPTIGWQSRWMYAAMSALTVGNVWLWLQMRDVNHQNEALQKAVTTVQTNHKDTVYRIDTIYQKVYLIDNHSNSESLTTITPTEYAALSTPRVAQNRATDVASSKSLESNHLKNRIAIENKKQQNIDNSYLNSIAKASNNTIATDSKSFKTEKKVEKGVLSNSSTENNITKSVENVAASNASNSNNTTKSVENNSVAIIFNQNSAKKNDNAASNPLVTSAATLDLAIPKTADASESRNPILNKADLVLLPLAFKALSPIEALEKESESIQVAGIIKPIKVKKQYNIFPKWGMPEINIGIIGTASVPSKQPTSGLGLGTDIALSRHWSVIASLEKHESHFNMGHRDNRLHLPAEPPPPGPDFKFTHLEGEFKDFRVSLGAKYVFLTAKKFRPYVSAQHVWKKAPPSFVAFKYQKATGEVDELPQTIESKSFANIWQIGAGMTGDFNSRWSWNVGLNYMFDFNAVNHNTNPLTLRAGVYYRL
jgi:hypothetical protein